MRAPSRPHGRGDAPADPIAWHPAMRRTLWTLKALTEGQRVLAYWTAMLLDEGAHHPNERRRARALQHASLLTPVLKAFLTHQGFHGSSAALQVLGGYGYVHDYGVEQHVRDARIAMVYEGTNEVQAIDLVIRKVLGDDGKALDDLIDDLLAATARPDQEPPAMAEPLKQMCAYAREAVPMLEQRRLQNPEAPFAVADDFLMALGYTLMAWAWLRMAQGAQRVADAGWKQDKLAAAQFGIDWLVPEGAGHWRRVLAPPASLPQLPG